MSTDITLRSCYTPYKSGSRWSYIIDTRTTSEIRRRLDKLRFLAKIDPEPSWLDIFVSAQPAVSLLLSTVGYHFFQLKLEQILHEQVSSFPAASIAPSVAGNERMKLQRRLNKTSGQILHNNNNSRWFRVTTGYICTL